MTVTARQMRESAMRAPTAEQRRIELDAARQAERRESEAVYGEAGPLVLELQQKLAESERSAVRERLPAGRDLQPVSQCRAQGSAVSSPWRCISSSAVQITPANAANGIPARPNANGSAQSNSTLTRLPNNSQRSGWRVSPAAYA